MAEQAVLEGAIAPGFPEWTELGQDTGLDPLAMQRATEIVFQNLLVGISTITLRARYYSFFAWMLETYALEIGVPDEMRFREFHRRAALLYALVCQNRGNESGVSGANWTYRALEEARQANGVIDFAEAADADAPVEKRYLRNKAGTFRGIYSNQMAALGIVHLGTNDNPVPICTKQGKRLAEAFGKENAEPLSKVLQVIEQGSVSTDELDALQSITLSSISPIGDEHEQLVKSLFAEFDDPGTGDRRRASTLGALLATVNELEEVLPVIEIKWLWYQRGLKALEDTPKDRSILVMWAIYQANDLLRFAYETILSTAIARVEAAEDKAIPMAELVGSIVSDAELPSAQDWATFVASLEPELEHGVRTRDLYEAMISAAGGERVHFASRLIGSLSREAGQLAAIMKQEFQPDSYYQSLSSEFDFLAERAGQPAEAVLADLVRKNVLLRHLFVASGKFRAQRAYTYHLEAEDGRLRFRMGFSPTPSSPRIEQALTFLGDLRMIEDGGLTEAGKLRAEFS